MNNANNLCDIIKDLLPLYHDGVSSEESNKIVKEHLENCSECRNYLDGISKTVFRYNKSKEEEAKIHSLLKLRKKFRIKKIIISAVSILCAAILFFTAQNFVKYHQFTVSYKEDILSSEKIYSAIDILQNYDYYSSHLILKAVDEKVIAYMYYTKTLWGDSSMVWRNRPYNTIDFFEHVEPSQLEAMLAVVSNDELVQFIQSDFYEMISAVYYFVGDYDKLAAMSDDEFFNATKDAVLIWEK